MDILISYISAKEQFPNEVNQIVSQLHHSKSKFKDAPPESLNWGFSWGVSLQDSSFSNIKAHLFASTGRSKYYELVPVVPKEILDYYAYQELQQKRRKEAFEKQLATLPCLRISNRGEIHKRPIAFGFEDDTSKKKRL